MTNEQIDLVLRIIAEIADNDESKAITFGQIHQKSALDSDELKKIIIFLGKEGYINNRHKVINELADIYITHLGIKQCFSFNTKEKIDLVLRVIAEIANNDESKVITFGQIHQKLALDSDELKKIIIFLGKEGYINNRHKVINELADIYITHLGMKRLTSS